MWFVFVFFFRYSIGLVRVQSLVWVWLRNQNDGNGPNKFNITNSNKDRTTVWTTENILRHVLIAITFNAFYGG